MTTGSMAGKHGFSATAYLPSDLAGGVPVRIQYLGRSKP